MKDPEKKIKTDKVKSQITGRNTSKQTNKQKNRKKELEQQQPQQQQRHKLTRNHKQDIFFSILNTEETIWLLDDI